MKDTHTKRVPAKQGGKKMRTLASEIKHFREWLTVNLDKTPSEKTLGNYEKWLSTLVRSYGLNVENLDPLKVALKVTKKKDLASSTKKVYKNALKHYLMYREFEINEELAKTLVPQKGERKKKLHPKDLITEDELRDILAHTSSPMLRAYYTMLWDTGARPSELARLNMEHIRPIHDSYRVTIDKSKTEGGKREPLLFTQLAIEHVGRWYNMHPYREDTSKPLFLNRYGNRIKVHTVLSSLRNQHNERLGRGNGNGKAPLSIYLFRKSAATRMLRNKTLQDHEIKTRLGHSKQSMMLEQYYAILDEEDQAKAELNALRKMQGLPELEEEEEERPLVKCGRCNQMNQPDNTLCWNCGQGLTEEAIQERTSLEERIANLEGYMKIQQIPDLQTRIEKLAQIAKDQELEKKIGSEDMDVWKSNVASTAYREVFKLLMETPDQMAHEHLEGLRTEYREQKIIDLKLAKAAEQFKDDPIAQDKALKEIIEEGRETAKQKESEDIKEVRRTIKEFDSQESDKKKPKKQRRKKKPKKKEVK